MGSGSGGPAVYLAVERGCKVTGVDINEHGIRNARTLAQSRGVADRARFEVVDARGELPFPAGRFDAIVSNDAMCHIAGRPDVLRDWHRMLKPGGRILFTDALVVTGPVTHEEVAARSSIGYLPVRPPGRQRNDAARGGFEILAVQDVTANAAEVASRWHDARARHREALVAREGQSNFDGTAALPQLRPHALGGASALPIRLPGRAASRLSRAKPRVARSRQEQLTPSPPHRIEED